MDRENLYVSVAVLQWFVKQQVEEEKRTNDILTRLRRKGLGGAGLFMIDRQLGELDPAE